MIWHEVYPTLEESWFLGQPRHSQHHEWNHYHPLRKPMQRTQLGSLQHRHSIIWFGV